MEQQFFLIADELGWTLGRQIEELDEFVRAYGAGGRMNAELAEIGLSLQQPLHRESLRDAMLRFIERLGAQGAFSHYLYGRLREGREARRAALAAERERVAAETAVVTDSGDANPLTRMLRRVLPRRASPTTKTKASSSDE
ncbi:hypothetical protein [Spiribacter vilamensis]|uniref:Uncharacterized protein n=1 Tax=Spiribacter vilamensis TaxID=531306 RepID=A0A4Q8D036_9GAMM|nr:hypothetical protein [Spiribacter vilamensis]RZU98659.1 hypothetical protein EV698_0914 [Spiribacter vilamensis]TVO60084.1 hypothetical protein FPL09_09625 [Spiribacter vilamensis]